MCILEAVGGGGQFVIHHPDGGFRRFELDPNGGHRLADGADQLTIKYQFDDGRYTFIVGDDRYSMDHSILPERAGE